MHRSFFTPETFNHFYIRDFIREVQVIFKLKGKELPNVFFDVSKTKKINIIGALLIYKFLDYSVHNKCFFHPETNISQEKSNTVSTELNRMGFKKLVEENFREQIKSDDKFVFQELKDCFVSPTVLEKDAAISSYGKSNELKINNYYSYNKEISSAILTCMGEISSNFQEHAEIDTRSVILAKGNKVHFEIACADNGIGIVSSLRPLYANDFRYRKNEYLLLKESIQKGISSKISEGHMGCGLWLANEFVTKSKGYLSMYSENGYLINKNGKIKCGESPYWKGTVIYLDIPLIDSNCFSEVLESVKTKTQYI